MQISLREDHIFCSPHLMRKLWQMITCGNLEPPEHHGRWGLGTVCDKGAKLKEKDPSKREGRQTELPTHLVPRAGPVGEDLRFSSISPGHYL